MEQVFGLDFNSDWADETTTARRVFNSLMADAIAPMYQSTSQFLGINVLIVSPFNTNLSSARQKRDVIGCVDALFIICMCIYGNAIGNC